MTFATKYRPTLLSEVAGHDEVKRILTSLIEKGEVFCHSYMFAGVSGIGKTTLARILARTMLCEDLQGVDPCGECPSCKSFLSGRPMVEYVELDAANHSGKDEIKSLLADLQYQNFGSSDRKVYLFDECHQLSKSAADALLKPMEDFVPDTQEKVLSALFCTTELHKMRSTLQNRCLVFQLDPPDLSQQVAYLERVCRKEGLVYEVPALTALAQSVGIHLRDQLQALYRVSLSGDVSLDNVRNTLALDTRDHVAMVLWNLTRDLPKALMHLEVVQVRYSPRELRDLFMELCISAYKAHVSIPPRIYADPELLKKIAGLYGDKILYVFQKLSEDLYPTSMSVVGNLVYLHRVLTQGEFETERLSLPKNNTSPETNTLTSKSRVSNLNLSSSDDLLGLSLTRGAVNPNPSTHKGTGLEPKSLSTKGQDFSSGMDKYT